MHHALDHWSWVCSTRGHHKGGNVYLVRVEFYFSGFRCDVHGGFEDNEGAKHLAQNPVCTSNSKHIDVRHHFLRELVFQGGIRHYSRRVGGSACRLSYKATQQCGFLLPLGFSDEYLMHFRDRRFYIRILVGRIYSFDFQSGEFRRWCRFHLAVSEKNAVLPGNRFWEFDDVLAAKEVLLWFEFFIWVSRRVLSVCRFDTGFRGDDFWCENMIFDWRIWFLVGRLDIDFRHWDRVHCSYNVSTCYVVPCHAEIGGDIGMVVCNEKGGCSLCSIVRRMWSIVD